MNEQLDQPTAFYVALDAARQAAGLTVVKACEVIGISVPTFYNWKARPPTAAKQRRALKRLADVGGVPTIVGKEPTAEVPPVVKALVKAVGLPDDDARFTKLPTTILTAEQFDKLRDGDTVIVRGRNAFGEPVSERIKIPVVLKPTIASIGAPMSHGIIPPVEVPDQRATTTKPEPQYFRFNA